MGGARIIISGIWNIERHCYLVKFNIYFPCIAFDVLVAPRLDAPSSIHIPCSLLITFLLHLRGGAPAGGLGASAGPLRGGEAHPSP
jgi:hypothetical protein